MVPFYLFTKNEKVLIKVNDAFTKLIFAPIALLITVCFVAFNLALLPFAYIAAIMKKVKFLRGQLQVDASLAEDDE